MKGGRRWGRNYRAELNILQQLATGHTVMVIGGRFCRLLNDTEILKIVPTECLTGLHFYIAGTGRTSKLQEGQKWIF